MTPRQRADTGLTDEQRDELLDRHPLRYPHAFNPARSAFDSLATMRETWERHVGPLVEDYARQRPGARPRAWWRWSAPADPAEVEWPAGVEGYAPPPPHLQPVRVQAAYLEEHGLLFTFEVGAWQGRP